MKDLKILREAYFYGNHIKLCFMIEHSKVRQDFTSLSRDIFPSLTKEEIEEIFKEKLNGIAMIEEFWNGIEIETQCNKDKESIKQKHNQVIQVLKDVFSELEKKEKERNLSSWLWRKKTFKLN